MNLASKRSVFCSAVEKPYVKKKNITFEMAKGVAVSQKQKNIAMLHERFMTNFHGEKPLEISSKSTDEIGVKLSAFHLKSKDGYYVENIFQSSKVFQNGGPYTDLLTVSPVKAKKDERLRNSGALIAFQYGEQSYPLNPTTAFYNWIYINALIDHPELTQQITGYENFTDIEFNPDKSLNCQAEAVAVYVGMKKAGVLEQALNSFEDFVKTAY